MVDAANRPEREPTVRERAFAAAVVGGCTLAEATRKAGYRETRGGFPSKLARRPRVKALIDAANRKLIERLEHAVSERIAAIEDSLPLPTLDRTVREMAALGLSDRSQCYNDDGSLKPISEWPEAARRALEGIEVTEGKSGRTVKPRFARKSTAHDQIMRYLGGYAPERHEHVMSVAALVVAAVEGVDIAPSLSPTEGLAHVEGSTSQLAADSGKSLEAREQRQLPATSIIDAVLGAEEKEEYATTPPGGENDKAGTPGGPIPTTRSGSDES